MKRSVQLARCLALGVAISLAGVEELPAVGFRLPNQDPMGIARGNAFVATADNPAAIYYNPAGITQLEGHNLSAGLYFITTNVDYDSVAGSAGTDETFQAVPQIHYVYSPPDSKVSFGLGVFAPYGLGIDWGNTSPFSTIAQNAQLLYASITPTLAYELTDTLSVAAGLTLNYSEVNFERALAPGGFGEFRFEGDGNAIGLTAGLLWQPHPQWSFGVAYRSPTEVSYTGDSKAPPLAPSWTTTSADLQFPQYVDVGVSYRPNEDWNFEINVDWTDFDAVNTSTFTGTFAGNVPFPFQYESSLMYEFGVTRHFANGWWASAGYIFSENSVPDATFSPLNPDSDLHLGSIGIGKNGDDWGWAIGYHFAYNDGRTVSRNIGNPLTAESANGDYETLNHAINFAIRHSF